jgi:hypothetical protein
MTQEEKLIEKIRILRSALDTIANDYQTTEQLFRNSKKQYGLHYHEVLEMAYENIQSLAKQALRTVRMPKSKTTQTQQHGTSAVQ